MPELPEVETIRNYLEKKYLRAKVFSIEILNSKQFIGDPADIVGGTIYGFNRHGKILTIEVKKRNKTIYVHIHLKMSGQLLEEKNEYTKIIITLIKNNKLYKIYFSDMRTFGWIKISEKKLRNKGEDVLSNTFTQEYFLTKVKKSKKDIKTLLLDQDILAGIGNIYANDALFTAGIYPFTKANIILDNNIIKLYKAIKDIIREGIDKKGSSKTKVYRLPDGAMGQYQKYFKVYDRENLPCIVCKTPIVRLKKQGRSSYYCPTCQK